MRTGRKFLFAAMLLSVFFGMLLFEVRADAAELDLSESAESGEISLDGFSEVVPDEVKDKLPQGMELDDIESFGKGVEDMTATSYVFSVIRDIFGSELSGAIKLFARLMVIIVLGGIFGTLKESFGESAIPLAVRFCTVSAIMALIMQSQYQLLIRVKEYFEHLNTMMLSMIPITGAAWAIGGNVSTATAGTATMYAFLNITQLLFSRTVLPVATMGTCFAFCNGIAPELGTKRISASVRKIYVFLLGGTMTLFTAMLTAQTTITAAADSTAARTAKFVSSTVIPIVGGSVGDSLRTVAAGVQYIKSVIGVGGIFLVLLTFLPVLIALLLSRTVFSLSSGMAELFNCKELGDIIGELSEVYSGVIAAVAMTGVMFILSFFIFIKTTVAIM